MTRLTTILLGRRLLAAWSGLFVAATCACDSNRITETIPPVLVDGSGVFLGQSLDSLEWTGRCHRSENYDPDVDFYYVLSDPTWFERSQIEVRNDRVESVLLTRRADPAEMPVRMFDSLLSLCQTHYRMRFGTERISTDTTIDFSARGVTRRGAHVSFRYYASSRIASLEYFITDYTPGQQ